jgi:Flp pilus assembly protein TadG
MVEFALYLPLIILLLFGLWEVGRFAQVPNVMSNCAGEAARDSSLSQDTLQTAASNLLTYLQSELPNAFNPSHSTSFFPATITLLANTTGYTCWDNMTNQELFTVTYTDSNEPSATDPTEKQKLNVYQSRCPAEVGFVERSHSLG